MAPALRLLLLLPGLLGATRGLKLIHSPDFDCSQPGIRCRVLNSTGLDWLRPHTWTPNAPSDLKVTAGIGKNDRGERAPVLEIDWTVSVDASIRTLQGAEISVMEFGTGVTTHIQFRFDNEFPGQRDRNNLPWMFSYNKFEVTPGSEYLVTVQHLPKENNNYREQRFSAPGCGSSDLMMQTDACCRQGRCWDPNITLDFSNGSLTVAFTPRRGASWYGVSVTIRPLKDRPLFQRLEMPEGATSERRQVVFPNPIPYEPCWYNVSVWPYMEPCNTDCVRQWFSPVCPTAPAPAPPGPSRRRNLWPIAAVVTIVAFTVAMTLLVLEVCIIKSSSGHKPLTKPVVPKMVKQKVLLVYSADHRRYVDVVIRLADFLFAWGLDVVLDRHHTQEISRKGVMPWLSHQKDQIEKTNGTILILCSKGAQAKWEARKNREAARVTLPEDTGYVSGDFFTSALNFIIPDFQRANPYDRYVVAYFDELCDVGDIPSLFEICPRYAVTKNLQNILFRIQRIERHQPNVHSSVDPEGNPSYRHLVQAVDHCRLWQQEHPDWFEMQCSPTRVEEVDESVEIQDEVGQDETNLTRRVYVQIRHPEASVAKQSPCIIDPDPIKMVSPSLADGPPSVCVAPLLNEEHASVAMLKPSLNTEVLRSYRQQPFLADVDESCVIRNERLLPIDLSPDEQGILSEDLHEAQMRLFCQSILENQPINPDEVLCAVESSQDPRLAGSVDQWVQYEDLGEAQMRLFRQNILENQPLNLDKVNCVAESSRDPRAAGLVDQWVESEDLGDAQMRLFLQNILENQDLNPNEVYCVAESSQDPRVAGLVDQWVPSEDLVDAQMRLFRQNILENQPVNSDKVFCVAESSQDPRAVGLVNQEESNLTIHDVLLPSDQGVQSMMEAQNISGPPEAPSKVFGGKSLFSSEGCSVEDDKSVYDCLLQMDSSTRPIQMNDLVEAQQKLFYQTILADQNLDPGMVFYTEPPPCTVHERQPLLVDAALTCVEPELQIDLSKHIGKGSQSTDLRETEKNWFNVLGGQRIIPKTDVPVDELDLYQEYNEPNLGFGVMGRTDQMHCHSEDLGYGTLNPNNLEALKVE